MYVGSVAGNFPGIGTVVGTGKSWTSCVCWRERGEQNGVAFCTGFMVALICINNRKPKWKEALEQSATNNTPQSPQAHLCPALLANHFANSSWPNYSLNSHYRIPLKNSIDIWSFGLYWHSKALKIFKLGTWVIIVIQPTISLMMNFRDLKWGYPNLISLDERWMLPF